MCTTIVERVSTRQALTASASVHENETGLPGDAAGHHLVQGGRDAAGITVAGVAVDDVAASATSRRAKEQAEEQTASCSRTAASSSSSARTPSAISQQPSACPPPACAPRTSTSASTAARTSWSATPRSTTCSTRPPRRPRRRAWSAGGHARPAEVWRWIRHGYVNVGKGAPLGVIQQALDAAGRRDQGAGATLAALADRGPLQQREAGGR